MEFSVWSVIIGLVIGGLLGAGLVWLLNKRSSNGSSAGQLRREHEAFKDEVTEHFVQTGELVNQLTDSYKEVIDHLRRGADQLVDPDTLERRLPSSNDSAVTVRRIGAHEDRAEDAPSLRHDAPASDAGTASDDDATEQDRDEAERQPRPD